MQKQSLLMDNLFFTKLDTWISINNIQKPILDEVGKYTKTSAWIDEHD